MDKIGSMIVLSGPSGVGKSTLVAALRSKMPQLRFSISCTTRAPRGSEVHGKEYYFLSEEDFSSRLAAGDFIENAQVFSRRYGTLKSEVLQYIEKGESVLLDIDVQGAMQIKAALASEPLLRRAADFIFIVPPSLSELEKRLRGRKTDSAEQVELRLGQSLRELSFWREYEYVIVNGDIKRAAADLLATVCACANKAAKFNREPFEK